MKPIRLLRIANVADNRTGGMSRTMHLTADHLREQGFEVRQLFADSFRWPRPGSWSRFLDPLQAGLMVHRVANEWGGCDLVEAHEPIAGGCGLVRSVLGASWKVVAFSYGLENRGFQAHLAQLGRSGSRLPAKSRMTGHLQGQISATGLRWCDHIVCSNQGDVDYLAERGYPASQLTRHFSGIDDAFLALGQQRCAHDAMGILFVGTWIERKGTRDIVEAVTRTLKIHPDARLTVAGCLKPSSDVISEFPTDLHPRIEVIPRVENPNEMAALYQKNSIFLLPSSFEGQPLVMMEAAAFGLAIVTTPVCGMLDFIRHNENGMFVNVGDANALCEAIDQLLNNPSLARSLGTCARRDVESLTWRASAANLAEAYRRLVAI